MLSAAAKTLAGMALVFGCLFTVGCTNTELGTAGPKQAAQSIASTRAEVVKAQNDLAETGKALEGLQTASGDLKPAYEKFKSAMTATQDQAKRAADRAVTMRENAAEYQKKWEEEIAVLNNPEVKQSAEQRVAYVRDRYTQIREIATDCRQKYAGLNSDLLDINQYLKSDLSATALDKVKPTIATVREHGDALNSRLNALVEEMNKLTAEINPTGKVPEK